MTVKRMDNVGIVVESLDAAISFFAELGLELEGRGTIEGEWAGRVTGLRDQRVETAMMRTPDGHGRLELSRFLAPPVVADHRKAPVNGLGYLRVMFAVEDIDDTLARLRKHGAQLVGEVVQYEDPGTSTARRARCTPVTWMRRARRSSTSSPCIAPRTW
jgi:catechol 2,3-dioxygenase-like lactoylglutathione lyase family enzyme